MKPYCKINTALLALDVSGNRVMSGMSQRDYAKKVGLSHTTLSRIERDITIPDLTAYALICKHLDVDLLCYLIFGYETTS